MFDRGQRSGYPVESVGAVLSGAARTAAGRRPARPEARAIGAIIMGCVVAFTALACSSSRTATGPSLTKCSLVLVTSPASLGPGGGTGAVSVTTEPECAWKASTGASWISGLSPASGQGNGQVVFLVPANPAATVRLDAIVVNDDRSQVQQQAALCQFALATSSQDVGAGGGTGTVTLNASATGCAWRATSDSSWIAVTSGDAGSGSVTVSFLIAANSGAERHGSLTIAGQIFTVRQGAVAVGCSYAVSPVSQSIGASGGTGAAVAVSAAAGCAWTAVSDVAWITVTAGASGSGNGTISLRIAANGSGARTGTVKAAGQTLSVAQAGACSYAITPTSQSIGAAGGAGVAVAIATAAGCGWTAVSNDTWISIRSGASGSGNGSVTFAVLANTDKKRDGTLTIAGRTFTVSQAKK